MSVSSSNKSLDSLVSGFGLGTLVLTDLNKSSSSSSSSYLKNYYLEQYITSTYSYRKLITKKCSVHI